MEVHDTALVILSEVSKVYKVGKSEVYALRDLSLAVSQNDFVAITGPSGSGKTTLMNLMGCLDMPTKGEVYLKGRKVNDLADAELARIRGEEVGFVFQTFNLIPRITALQNVLLPMAFTSGVPKSERRARALRLLEKVGLAERIDHKPAEMSGGERQRVSIARALANDPSIVLADEPTGNLDSETGREVMDSFTALNEEGRTIVVVTHNPAVSARVRRSVELRDGRIANAAQG